MESIIEWLLYTLFILDVLFYEEEPTHDRKGNRLRKEYKKGSVPEQ